MIQFILFLILLFPVNVFGLTLLEWYVTKNSFRKSFIRVLKVWIAVYVFVAVVIGIGYLAYKI